MPKLSGDTAKKVDEAESGFALLEPGIYRVRLNEVETGEGPKGPYWKWEFEIPEGEAVGVGRKLWTNTSLAENAAWKLKEMFDAFGVAADTDTDDLIGRHVLAEVGQRTIQKGARTGELANDINAVRPDDAGAGSVPAATNGKAKSKADAALF